ncbi:MAG: hypothetical protein ACREXU_19955 [Gammaproteobacteria bacterium]
MRMVLRRSDQHILVEALVVGDDRRIPASSKARPVAADAEAPGDLLDRARPAVPKVFEDELAARHRPGVASASRAA